MASEQDEGPSKEKARRKPRKLAHHQGLFPCEDEIARRLSQEPRDWRAKAIILERSGLPRVDPLMGGRFWPAVEAFFNNRYGLSVNGRVQQLPSQPDGPENLEAFNYDGRRRKR